MEWQPIATAPPNTWMLTFADWDAEAPVAISKFVTVEKAVETVESECHNKKGRRRVIQEEMKMEREWHGQHFEPTHWMPLPEAPKEI